MTPLPTWFVASGVVWLLAAPAALAVQGGPADGVAAPPPAQQAVSVADVALGMHASGAELSPESLRHRVVFLTLCRMKEKASLACLPLLERAHVAHGPAEVLVVACFLGKPAPAEVREIARKRVLTLPLYDGGSVKGLTVPDAPRALLFDHTGACIAQGSPEEVAAEIAAAAGRAPPQVLAGRQLAKLASLVPLLRDEARHGAALRKADALADSDDPEITEEARYVVERLTTRAGNLLAEAESLKDIDAVAAAGLVQQVATTFRGYDVGTRATELQREWRQDRQFTNGLKAAGLAGQLEALRAQAIAFGGGTATIAQLADVATARRIPPQMKAQLAQLAGSVLKLSPGSRYADRAEEIAVELGLELPAPR